jgi:hypothetical protein
MSGYRSFAMTKARRPASFINNGARKSSTTKSNHGRETRTFPAIGNALDPNPPPSYRRTLEAIRYLESAVTT